jgi:hypothetical protein
MTQRLTCASSTTVAIGFFWSFALKFPHSVRSLLYRRCVLGESTHVAICVYQVSDDNEVTFDFNYISGIRRFFSGFYSMVHGIMTFLFSDHNTFGCPRTGNIVNTICPVQTDTSGTRYILFRLRRYILDEDKFVPGELKIGPFIKDIVQADTLLEGLSNEECEARRHVVGRNTISMEKPNYLRTLKREVSKPFYTYQTFMVWTVSQG